MEHSEKLDEIAPALLALQTELSPVRKDGQGHHGAYPTLGACIEEVIPKANALDLSLTQWGAGQALTTMLLHSSGQFIAGDLDLILQSLDPQAQGASITYARRYMLSASVCLSAEDDDAQGVTDQMRADTHQNPPAGTSPPPQGEPAPAQDGGAGGQSSPPATGMWWPDAMWRDRYQLDGVQKAAEEAGLTKEQIDKYVAAMKYERTKNNGDKFTVRSAEYLDKPLRADMEVRINTRAVANWLNPPAAKEGVDDIPDDYRPAEQGQKKIPF
jgi:hypothetical protein